jgi:NADPH:quinone reductase-like Zn-dependent oxidoreductase
MPTAVRFHRYGGPEVLKVVSVERPVPAAGQVLVEVVAAALNPGEIGIREGVFAGTWPARFPEGQGNDFAGVVAEVGPGAADFAVGQEVIGFAPRAAHAEFALVPADSLTAKPPELDWEPAACIAGVGATAWATVEAVSPQRDDLVVVSAAAGGVGVIAAQLARLRGARVIGTAGHDNAGLLRALGVEPVQYGPGLLDRIAALAPEGVDAYLDNFGAPNVDIALALGVKPARINTIADGEAVRAHGVHHRAQEDATSPALWRRLAELAARGEFTIPIAATYPLDRVQQAYRDVATRHVGGKRVLRIRP